MFALVLVACTSVTQTPKPDSRPPVPLPHRPAVILRGPTAELLKAMREDPDAFEIALALDELTAVMDARGFGNTSVRVGLESAELSERLARAHGAIKTWKAAHKAP